MNDSVSKMITKKIDDIVKEKNIYYSGQVVRINNFIIEARGLDDVFFFEKVYINNENNIGYVDKIETNTVFISLIKTNGKIVAGDSVITTGEVLEMSFSEDSVGMIIDPFGVDRMTGKKLNNSFSIPVETEKIGIMERTAVKRPLETGIAAIDLMFPIGRGQRQLILGDKKTGKSQICLDTIVNQKDKNVLCIYVSIGKNKKELKNLYAKLIQKGANAYTIIVSAFNDDLPPLIKITPYVALSIAEHYLKKSIDVLVCIDDLKKHADACREIALLSEKNTGRDAYPADIFYTHSRLLEKGCQHKNGGSITILPIVETKGGDITDYISTNVISITDGQIVLSDKMFKKGQKPAINYGLSVSRLGSSVQNELIKQVGAKVRRELLTYLEKVDVYQLVNIESMSPDLQNQLKRGAKILDALKQPKFSPISANELKERFAFIDEEIVVEENNDENKLNSSDDSSSDDSSNSGNKEIDDKQEETNSNVQEETPVYENQENSVQQSEYNVPLEENNQEVGISTEQANLDSYYPSVGLNSLAEQPLIETIAPVYGEPVNEENAMETSFGEVNTLPQENNVSLDNALNIVDNSQEYQPILNENSLAEQPLVEPIYEAPVNEENAMETSFGEVNTLPQENNVSLDNALNIVDNSQEYQPILNENSLAEQPLVEPIYEAPVNEENAMETSFGEVNTLPQENNVSLDNALNIVDNSQEYQPVLNENSLAEQPLIESIDDEIVNEENAMETDFDEESPMNNEYIEKTEILPLVDINDYNEKTNIDASPSFEDKKVLDIDAIPNNQEEDIDTEIVPIIKKEDNYEC